LQLRHGLLDGLLGSKIIKLTQLRHLSFERCFLAYNLNYFFISLLFKTKLMKKNYFYIITLLVFLFSINLSAQESKQQPRTQETSVIEGLNLYPNPVSNGKVYILTKNDLEKEVVIFDVLGKKVLQTMISSKELNISNLIPGVYIIKITENNSTATRKLIVR
jgi:hypothetical protein